MTRYEDDAAPTALVHLRQIGARDANAAHDVDFEHLAPLVVGEVDEAFARVHGGEIIDEDIDRGDHPLHCFGALSGREIPGAGDTVAPGSDGPDAGDGAVDALRGAAIHPDMCAGFRQSRRDCEADARSRPRDQGDFPREIEIHVTVLWRRGVNAQHASKLKAALRVRLHR